MARLINCGPGEICDRLTILALKIHHGRENNHAIKHFVDEYHSLLATMKTRDIKWFEEALELSMINGTLWSLNDDVRALGRALNGTEHATLRTIGTIALKMMALNDRRSAGWMTGESSPTPSTETMNPPNINASNHACRSWTRWTSTNAATMKNGRG